MTLSQLHFCCRLARQISVGREHDTCERQVVEHKAVGPMLVSKQGGCTANKDSLVGPGHKADDTPLLGLVKGSC